MRSTILSLLVFVLFFQCASSSKSDPLPEPVLEQVTQETGEVCLGWKFLFGGGYPCIKIRGEKENSSGKITYTLRYEVGTFDVDLPLGLSVKLGDTWYLLTKMGTEYSSTVVFSSRISPELVPLLLNAPQITFSYTTRKGTENRELSASKKETLQTRFKDLIRSLEAESKLKIEKK